MSLKAGRVGVNPSDVDPVSGHINSSSTDAYTKAQVDDKFLSKSDAGSTYLSKTDAASTYESKSDASTAHNQLQPKTLAVPIEMLSGTKLTVETALQGLNDIVSVADAAATIDNDFTANTVMNTLRKFGNIVFFCYSNSSITVAVDAQIGTIPEGYRPASYCRFIDTAGADGKRISISAQGLFKTVDAFTGSDMQIRAMWMV